MRPPATPADRGAAEYPAQHSRSTRRGWTGIPDPQVAVDPDAARLLSRFSGPAYRVRVAAGVRLHQRRRLGSRVRAAELLGRLFLRRDEFPAGGDLKLLRRDRSGRDR